MKHIQSWLTIQPKGHSQFTPLGQSGGLYLPREGDNFCFASYDTKVILSEFSETRGRFLINKCVNGLPNKNPFYSDKQHIVQLPRMPSKKL